MGNDYLMPNILFLCTVTQPGSVMATVMMRSERPEYSIRGAGTFSISGLPMSQRTPAQLTIYLTLTTRVTNLKNRIVSGLI